MGPSVWTECLGPQPTESLKKERQLLQSGCCTNNGKVWRLCALRLYTLATAVPVGATFLNPPHLNAFEGPLGAYCHVDVAFPVGVEALSGSRAFRSHSPTGMKNPFFGCTWKREKHWTLNRAHSCRAHILYSVTHTHFNKLKDDREAAIQRAPQSHYSSICLTFIPLQHSPPLHFQAIQPKYKVHM